MALKKRKNILITGANGFVGKALVAKLLQGTDALFLVSRDGKFKCPGAKVFYGDLNDPAFCKKIVKNIDIVYYLAGFKKNIAVHAKEPFNTLMGNVRPLLNFLEAAQNSSIKKIMYTSSTMVEYADSQAEHRDGYVMGKYINEIILQSFAVQGGIGVKIVRLAAIYGPGNDFDPQTANLIPSLIAKAHAAKDEIEMWGKGTRKLQFAYIDDVASNLVAALHSKGDLFSIGNPEAISIKALVQKILKLMDKKASIRHDLTKPDKETKLAIFNNIVAPKTDLEAGLRRTIEDYIFHHA